MATDSGDDTPPAGEIPGTPSSQDPTPQHSTPRDSTPESSTEPDATEPEPTKPEPTKPDATKPDLTKDERAELEHLRKRSSGRAARGARTVGSAVAIVLACVIALVSVIAVWADDIVEDTDRYVETVAPLAHDPAVQEAVTNRVTTAVTNRIDMTAVTDALANTLGDNGLPPNIADQLRRLSGPLESGVESFVRREVQNVVESDVFEDLWVTANRQVHATLVKALTGEGNSTVNVQGGTVTLELGPLVSTVQERLVDRGFTLAEAIPDVDKSIVLVQSDKLDDVRTYVRILHQAGWWLPVIALAFAALGVWLAPNRRRAIMGVGIGVLAAMIVLGVALALGRRIYLDRLPSSVSSDAAAAIFDTLIRFLRESTRTLGVLGALTAITAFLFGPGKVATTVRGSSSAALASVGRTAAGAGARTGAAGAWIAKHRHPLYIGVVAAGGVWLLLWNRPTVGSVVLVAVLVLVVLVLLEIAAAVSEAPPPEGGPGATTWTADSMAERTKAHSTAHSTAHEAAHPPGGPAGRSGGGSASGTAGGSEPGPPSG